jgi:hypothetical protein
LTVWKYAVSALRDLTNGRGVDKIAASGWRRSTLGTLEPLRDVKPVTGCISRLATPRSAESCERQGQNMVVPTLVVRPGEGRSVSLGGMGVVFKVSGADTGGAFAVVEHPIEPGRLVLPHVHLREDEYSYVLEAFNADGSLKDSKQQSGVEGLGHTLASFLMKLRS